MKVLKCKKCGKIVEVLHEGCPVVMCCGEEMTELVANTTDAAQEKHVPTYEIKEDKLIVTVGEVEHPMEENHYIEWIAVEREDEIQRVYLEPGFEPTATFQYKENATIYAYCNLHGLWKNEIK